ncbi:MAG: EamA family transporter [Actinomycetota bacterium]
MSPGRIAAALALLAVSAVLHAVWNLLAKRVPSGLPFVWCVSATSAIVFLPVAVIAYAVERPTIGGRQLAFVAVSGSLHAVYFLALQRGYRDGDLSVVYPIARGTGALLAATAGLLFLGEQADVLSVGGILLAVGGVFALTGTGHALRRGELATGAEWGLLTGGAIASYTLSDRYAVTALGMPPVVQYPLTVVMLTAVLTPFAARRRAEVRMVCRAYRGAVVRVAIISTLAYMLVLTALSFAPVSFVAPARELSIVVAVALGARVLGEVDVRRRLVAAGAIVAGIAVLTLSLA